MADGDRHWPKVQDKLGFLHRLMVELAGDAHMSLEGDLSKCAFTDDVVVSRDETGVLKRNTLAPRQDFVVLRLTPEMVDPIFQQVVAVGLNRAILHLQIERNEVLELGAYDNFHPDCIVTGPGVSPVLLGKLKTESVLRESTVVDN